MLGIADEDGWVQILDTRKKGSRSIVKGILYYRLNLIYFLLGKTWDPLKTFARA